MPWGAIHNKEIIWRISIKTVAFIQVHASAESGVVMEAATFLGIDVKHSLEVSQAEYHEL